MPGSGKSSMSGYEDSARGETGGSGARLPKDEVVLAVRNLRTWLDTPGVVVKAVDDVSFDVPAAA